MDGLRLNEIVCADALEFLQGLPDGCVDATIIDPPYGSQLCGEWDVQQDALSALTEIGRVSREFVAWFGQFPDSWPWYAASHKLGWHLCEHIIWVKRNNTTMDRINRGHESVFVWAVGNRRQFYTTKGPYEDVKVPGVLVDLISVDGIARYITTLHAMLAGTSDGLLHTRTEQRRWGSGHKFAKTKPTQRSPRNANFTNVWSFFPPNCRQAYNGLSPEDYHPCRKPLELLRRLVVMLTDDGGAVLDCYVGGGTTAEACVLDGREFLACDNDAGYCEIARARVEHWRKVAIAEARRFQGSLFSEN
jgi:DNA modification methylase